jgi:hypothetical protein
LNVLFPPSPLQAAAKYCYAFLACIRAAWAADDSSSWRASSAFASVELGPLGGGGGVQLEALTPDFALSSFNAAFAKFEELSAAAAAGVGLEVVRHPASVGPDPAPPV